VSPGASSTTTTFTLRNDTEGKQETEEIEEEKGRHNLEPQDVKWQLAPADAAVETSLYECEHNCGFRGAFGEVAAHEQACAACATTITPRDEQFMSPLKRLQTQLATAKQIQAVREKELLLLLETDAGASTTQMPVGALFHPPGEDRVGQPLPLVENRSRTLRLQDLALLAEPRRRKLLSKHNPPPDSHI
jgi:hypothetical protein